MFKKVCGHWWKLFNSFNHKVALSMRQGKVSTFILRFLSVQIGKIAIISSCDFKPLRSKNKKFQRKINQKKDLENFKQKKLSKIKF